MKQAKSTDMKSAFSNLVGSVKRMARVIGGGVVFVKNDIQLLIAFMQDYRQYRKASLFCQTPFNQDKTNARMMLIGHSLEKGMSFETKKADWGREKAIQLCTIMREYINKYPVSDEFVSCLNILKAYRNDDNSCKLPEVTKIIDSFIFDYHDYLKEGYAGVKDVMKPDSFDENLILSFYQSRASVRNFADEPVSREEIEKAMVIARTTPTACNRQTSKVYTIDDRNKIKQILDLQRGNQGWADKASAMFIITGNLSSFGGITERQQVYIDGGLFAMNFVMGLHLYGVASCFKMFIRDKKSQDKIMQFCGIPSNEVPIVLVMAGHYRDIAVKDPVSRRFERFDIKI